MASRMRKVWTVAVSVVALATIQACDGDEKIDGGDACTGPCLAVKSANPHSKHPKELAEAFAAIADNDPQKAKDILEAFIADETNVPEIYTYAIASLHLGVNKLSPLISLINSNTAPGLAPVGANDLKTIVSGALSKITEQLGDIADQAPKLVDDTDEPYVVIPTVPINFDISVFATDLNLPDDLGIDLGGRWDRTELKLLGALGDGLLAGINFLLAHEIIIDIGLISPITDDPTTEAIVNLLLGSKTNDGRALLALSAGGADDIKGAKVKDRIVRALGYLVDGTNGLLGTIEAEYTDGVDHSNDIIQFQDVDGDGKVSRGDKVYVPLIAKLAEQVGDVDENGEDDLVQEDATIEVDVSRGSWVGLIELGQDIKADITAGASGEPVEILSRIYAGVDSNDGSRIWDDLQRMDREDGDDPVVDAPQDWLRLKPGAYFAAPVGLRDLLPAVQRATITTQEDGQDVELVVHDLAIECELAYTSAEFASDVTDVFDHSDLKTDILRVLCGNGTLKDGETDRGRTPGYFLKRVMFSDSPDTVAVGAGAPGTATVDFAHFAGAAWSSAGTAATSVAEATVTSATDLTMPTLLAYDWEESMAPLDTDVAIDADGFVPVRDQHNDVALAIVLQDPSMDGVLYIDAKGEGNVALGSHQSVNDLINAIWLVYGDDIQALIDDAVN